jgi:hypothetical protein
MYCQNETYYRYRTFIILKSEGFANFARLWAVPTQIENVCMYSMQEERNGEEREKKNGKHTILRR